MQTDSTPLEDLSLTSEQRKAVGFLAEFTRRMVVLAFAERRTPANASNLIREVYRVTDDMLTGRLETGTRPACRTKSLGRRAPS